MRDALCGFGKGEAFVRGDEVDHIAMTIAFGGEAPPGVALEVDDELTLQNCMVYVNTLMLQQVLAQPHWQGRLTATDMRALTPLIWEHVNPYGRFDLDMTTRLPLT